MEENELSGEKQSSPEAVSIPKKVRPSKEAYLKARIDYETGNFQDLKQLSTKYSLDYAYLRQKVHREDWKEFKVAISAKVSQKIAEKIENKVDLFFNSLEKKANYYEKLVEASQSQAARNSEGIPQLDPCDLETYSKVEARAIDWKKTAYGVSDKVMAPSVTLNVNVLGILDKLRAINQGKTIDGDAIEAELKDCKLIEG